MEFGRDKTFDDAREDFSGENGRIGIIAGHVAVGDVEFIAFSVERSVDHG